MKKQERQVQELIDKGLISESLIPCVVSIVLAPIKGEWRMYINLRAINKIIIRYSFLIPKFKDLMDCLRGA